MGGLPEEFQQRQLAMASQDAEGRMLMLYGQGGRAIGRAVGKAYGAQTQQEHDIQIYKQNCE